MLDTDVTGPPGDDDAGRLEDLLYRVVALTSPVRVDQVRADHKLVLDLAFDSLRTLELVCVLDDLFGVQTMLLDEAPVTTTVGELLDHLKRMVREGLATCPDFDQAEAVFRELPFTERHK